MIEVLEPSFVSTEVKVEDRSIIVALIVTIILAKSLFPHVFIFRFHLSYSPTYNQPWLSPLAIPRPVIHLAPCWLELSIGSYS